MSLSDNALLGAALGATLTMGVAVSCMRDTGMRAMSVHAAREVRRGGTSALVQILLGPAPLLLFVGPFVSPVPTTKRHEKRAWGTRPGEGSGEKLERTPFER